MITDAERLERFLAKISIDSTGCWVWTASENGHGYGQFNVGGKTKGAHRYSFEWFVGTIPDGLQLDHLCRNRKCVNPSHLEPVTQRINLLRGEGIPAKEAAQTQCVHGHPFDELNTYVYPNGKRKCRACHKVTNRRWRANKVKAA